MTVLKPFQIALRFIKNLSFLYLLKITKRQKCIFLYISISDNKNSKYITRFG